jgi:hypothetical protein
MSKTRKITVTFTLKEDDIRTLFSDLPAENELWYERAWAMFAALVGAQRDYVGCGFSEEQRSTCHWLDGWDTRDEFAEKMDLIWREVCLSPLEQLAEVAE